MRRDGGTVINRIISLSVKKIQFTISIYFTTLFFYHIIHLILRLLISLLIVKIEVKILLNIKIHSTNII